MAEYAIRLMYVAYAIVCCGFCDVLMGVWLERYSPDECARVVFSTISPSLMWKVCTTARPLFARGTLVARRNADRSAYSPYWPLRFFLGSSISPIALTSAAKSLAISLDRSTYRNTPFIRWLSIVVMVGISPSSSFATL